MRRLRLLALPLAFLPLVLAGCGGNCKALAQKVCNCNSTTTTQREQCAATASNEASRAEPTPEEESTCAALIDGCSCDNLNTPEGKTACGMAR